MAVTKNQEYTVTVEGYSGEGAGVARIDGFVVFVSGALRGEVCRVLILKVLKSAAFAKVLEVLVPSPHRIAPDCPYFPRCGGCTYRHMDYAEELALKRRRVQDNLARIGGSEVEVEEILGAAETRRYRNKAQYPVGCENGELKIGFYSRRSHRIVDCRACRLAPPEFEKILGTVANWIEKYNISVYDETIRSGAVRHIYLRKAFATGEIMLCLVSAQENLPHTDKLIESLKDEKAIKSMLININPDDTNAVLGEKCIPLLGDGCITDILCGVKVRISPLSFYQVNRAQAEKLYKKAAEYAGDKKIKLLLDLYCGMGTIGLSMADHCRELIGVEIVPEAIESAKANAARMGAAVSAKSRFFCADAGQAAAQLAAEGLHPDVVILDPPRKGCDEATLSAVVKMNPQRVVYVSCNPATAARDAKWLETQGYRTEKVQPVDLFPRTKHCEAVLLLTKLNVERHIEVDVSMDELDVTAAESKATYNEIRDYVWEHHQLRVSNLYIAQVKQKHGIIERENYHKAKNENTKQPKCPKEKEDAIVEALKHFQMI